MSGGSTGLGSSRLARIFSESRSPSKPFVISLTLRATWTPCRKTRLDIGPNRPGGNRAKAPVVRSDHEAHGRTNWKLLSLTNVWGVGRS